MKTWAFKKTVLGVAVAVLLGVTPRAGMAQVTTVDVSGGVDEPIEEIVVIATGTSIRGIAPVGTAPIEYQRADIEADSPVDVADALANVPAIANFGLEQQLGTTNRFRTAGFIPVIHNMEIGSTLTLFNGHRMAATGAEATFSDPSAIPTIALDRVEVVADGNSAIYGSDAVAGVVNFIYRRGVEGFEVDLSATEDSGSSFDNTNYSMLWGHVFDRGEMMVAYQRSEHTAPLQREFWFSRTGDHTGIGNAGDRRTTTCPEPRITFSGVTYSGPDRLPGVTYRCDPDQNNTIGFDSERDAVLATARFDASENVELWAEFNWTNYIESRLWAWPAMNVTIPSSSPFFWVPAGVDPTGVTSERAQRNALGLFPLRYQPEEAGIVGVTVGATMDIGSDWQAVVRGHHSRTDDLWDVPTYDVITMQDLITAGLWNPLDTAADNDPAVTAEILNGYTTLNRGKQSLDEIEVKADGPIGEISGGQVMMAVGVNHYTESLRQIQESGCKDASCSFYSRIRDDDMARGKNSLFAEFAIPLVSDLNAKPGIKELNLSLAGRYDKYDLLKGETTPKVGLTYRPVDSLSFHGSWGKSYVAPNMGLSTSTFTLVQTGVNVSGTGPWNIINLGGGSPLITSEKAETYSLGFEWEPVFAEGVHVGVTYYNVAYTNLIYKPGRPDVIFNPAFESARIVAPGNEGLFGDDLDVNLTLDPALVASLLAIYPPDRPIPDGQTFNIVHRSYAINLGKRNFEGVDLNLRYDFDTDIGEWDFGIVANRQITREQQVLPTDPFASDIGTFAAPPWQARFQTRWTAENLPLTLTWVTNYKSGYNNVNTNWCCNVAADVRHNLTFAYDMDDLWNGVTLQARIINLTDEDPPFVDTTIGYDDDNSVPWGRQYAVTLRARF